MIVVHVCRTFSDIALGSGTHEFPQKSEVCRHCEPDQDQRSIYRIASVSFFPGQTTSPIVTNEVSFNSQSKNCPTEIR